MVRRAGGVVRRGSPPARTCHAVMRSNCSQVPIAVRLAISGEVAVLSAETYRLLARAD